MQNDKPKKIKYNIAGKTILDLALPSMGEFMLKMLLGIVDTAIVGRLGAEALAISGLSWQLLFFFSMVLFGFQIGATAVIARYIGAKEQDSAELAAGQALLVNMLAAALVTIFLLPFAKHSLLLLGAEPAIAETGGKFMQILLVAFIPANLLFAAGAIIRATGDTKTPMIIIGIVNVFNIFLDFGFVFGNFGFPKLGVLGAAWASAIAQVIGFIIIYGAFFLGKFKIKLRLKYLFMFNRQMLSRIVKISLPAAAENFFASAANIVFVWIVASMGTVAIAANSLLLRAESLSFMPGLGFSVATNVTVGQALGEKDLEKAEAMTWEAARLCMYFTGAMGLLFLLFPEMFIRIFTTDAAVIAASIPALRVVSFIEPVQGLMFVMMGALKGAGDTRTTFKISAVGMMLVRVPLGYLLGITARLGIAGAWAAMCFDIAFRTIWAHRRYKGREWGDIQI